MADYNFSKVPMGVVFSIGGFFSILVFSKQENGSFCLPCVLFATSGYHGSDPGVLVSHPLTAFTKASCSISIQTKGITRQQ